MLIKPNKNSSNENIPSFNSLPFILPNNDYERKPMLTITFDDECEDIYKYAFPVFKQEEVPATFFVVPNRIGDGVLRDWGVSDTWEHIEEMDSYKGKGRVKIECHSWNHSYLPGLTREQLEKNFTDCIDLFKKHNIDVNHISYPGGYYNDLVQHVTQKYFQTGRTTIGGYMDYTIHPHTIVSRGMDGNSEYAKMEIDKALEKNCWVSFFAHGCNPNGKVVGATGERPVWTPNQLTEIIQYAKSKGVEIVSYDKAVATFCPSYCWINRNGDAPFVVQRDGVVTKFTGDEPFVLPI